MIWIPYFLYSERVKETFVINAVAPEPPKDDNLTPPVASEPEPVTM